MNPILVYTDNRLLIYDRLFEYDSHLIKTSFSIKLKLYDEQLYFIMLKL